MHYDDGEVEHLMLSAEHVRWDKRPLNYVSDPNQSQPQENANKQDDPKPEAEINASSPQQEIEANAPSASMNPPSSVEIQPKQIVVENHINPAQEDNAEERARVSHQTPWDHSVRFLVLVTAIYFIQYIWMRHSKARDLGYLRCSAHIQFRCAIL